MFLPVNVSNPDALRDVQFLGSCDIVCNVMFPLIICALIMGNFQFYYNSLNRITTEWHNRKETNPRNKQLVYKLIREFNTLSTTKVVKILARIIPKPRTNYLLNLKKHHFKTYPSGASKEKKMHSSIKGNVKKTSKKRGHQTMMICHEDGTMIRAIKIKSLHLLKLKQYDNNLIIKRMPKNKKKIKNYIMS